jgi:hypothetical protein
VTTAKLIKTLRYLTSGVNGDSNRSRGHVGYLKPCRGKRIMKRVHRECKQRFSENRNWKTGKRWLLACNIQTYLREISWHTGGWVALTKNRLQFRALCQHCVNVHFYCRELAEIFGMKKTNKYAKWVKPGPWFSCCIRLTRSWPLGWAVHITRMTMRKT